MRKLLRTERTIAKYNISDEHIVSEYNIDDITLDILLSVIIPKDDDPLLYEGYVLTENQLIEINSHLKNRLHFDLINFYYVLECSGIYD